MWIRSRLGRLLLIAGAVVAAALLVPWGVSRLLRSPIVSLQLDHVDAPGARRPDGELRVGTYNIAHGRGLSSSNWTGESERDRRARLLAIGELLARSDLDVVVLNEVDFDAPWSHGIDQAQVIARAAGYPYVVEVPNLDVRVGPVLYRFGNALLSRYPLVDASVVDLPAFSLLETFLAGKKRGLAVTVETPDGPVRLVGVHLSHRSEAVRVASARHLIALARGCPLPVIIAGDMNSTPSTFPRAQLDDADRNAMDVLRATGRWRRRPLATPRANELTFHSARPTRVIDWILVPRPWTVEAYEVLDTDLSDHLPVVANVGMERPSTR